MISIILLIIALFLDGFLSIIIPLNSIFLPLITITTIYIIFPYFKKKEKKYYILSFAVGIIYDLLYTNLLLFHAIIFMIIAYITKYLYTTYEQTKITKVLYQIIIIILSELLTASFLFLFQTTTITFTKIIYKITHSILLNIIYAVSINMVLNKKS